MFIGKLTGILRTKKSLQIQRLEGSRKFGSGQMDRCRSQPAYSGIKNISGGPCHFHRLKTDLEQRYPDLHSSRCQKHPAAKPCSVGKGQSPFLILLFSIIFSDNSNIITFCVLPNCQNRYLNSNFH